MGFITIVPFGTGEFSQNAGRKQVLKEPRSDTQPICFAELFLQIKSIASQVELIIGCWKQSISEAI